jgi:hypothetical protein
MRYYHNMKRDLSDVMKAKQKTKHHRNGRISLGLTGDAKRQISSCRNFLIFSINDYEF